MIYISYFQTKIASTLFYLNKFLPIEAKSYLIYKSLDSFNIYLKDKIIILSEFLIDILKTQLKILRIKLKKDT